MVLRLISFLSISLMLTGCASQNPVIIDGIVTAKCPPPPSISRPILEINKLPKNASNKEKSKALVITNKQLLDYSIELEEYLEVYR